MSQNAGPVIQPPGRPLTGNVVDLLRPHSASSGAQHSIAPPSRGSASSPIRRKSALGLQAGSTGRHETLSLAWREADEPTINAPEQTGLGSGLVDHGIKGPSGSASSRPPASFAPSMCRSARKVCSQRWPSIESATRRRPGGRGSVRARVPGCRFRRAPDRRTYCPPTARRAPHPRVRAHAKARH
jgi:hypothetical protein